MQKFTHIRQLYTPIQPTVKSTDPLLSYMEYLPDPCLLPYIYCYYECKSNKTLDETFMYQAVADGCMDIYFEINNLEEQKVMGFCNSMIEVPLGIEFRYIGIRFLPTMFPQIYRMDAHELAHHAEYLRYIAPRTFEFICNRISAEMSMEHIIMQLNAHFAKLLTYSRMDKDVRLYEALDIIFKSKEPVNIMEDLKTGVSAQQLQRIFKFYIGDTAKSFSKIVRFQRILNGNYTKNDLKEKTPYLENGFYDQSHFIKEFKDMYGLTPGKVFK